MAAGTVQGPWIRVTRKVVVAVVGFTVLAFGLAFIALPLPSVLVIPLGLAILATEFVWARKLLGGGRDFLLRLKIRAGRRRPTPLRPDDPTVDR